MDYDNRGGFNGAPEDAQAYIDFSIRCLKIMMNFPRGNANDQKRRILSNLKFVEDGVPPFIEILEDVLNIPMSSFIIQIKETNEKFLMHHKDIYPHMHAKVEEPILKLEVI